MHPSTVLPQLRLWKEEKMKTRRLFSLIVSLIVVFTLVAGCAPAQPAVQPGADKPAAEKPAEMVEITLAVNTEGEAYEGWRQLIDEANQQLASKNIKIVPQNTASPDWPTYYQKVTAQMAAGNPPDIGRIAESFMPTVIDNNQVLDLTPYMNELDMAQYYGETFKNAGYRDGRNYGLPSGVFFMVMYYNKDLFDKANLPYPSGDWEKASSFSEVQQFAKSLTSGEGANKTWGFFAGPYMGFVGSYALSNGGKNVFGEDGACALTDPESQEVYKWFNDMMMEDKSMPSPTDLQVVGPDDLFINGKLGMIVNGTWVLNRVLNEVKDFEVGIAAVPAGKTGNGYSSAFVDNWVIWKGSKHEREAWEALKAIYSAEGWEALAATGTGGIPIHRDTTKKLVDETVGNKISPEDKATFVAALDHSVAVPYNSFYEQVDQLANNSMDEWRLGQITYEEYARKVCGFIDDAVKSQK
jgi:ABC-type glycerol-3-phosphate transport system substrate-binding protein